MNDKLKRAVAIIALIFVAVFTVSLILYLYDKTLFNGAIGDLALWSGAFGGLLALVLWISHSFPAQQRKDEEREKLYKEAEEQEEKARSSDEPQGGDSAPTENEAPSADDDCQSEDTNCP